MANLEGTEIATNKRYSQVYQATHKGEQPLPFMNRSFISFTYGGKKIEDFDLIATTNGDRMQRNGYAQFNDITSSYDILDGQFYWSTHYTNNQMDFILSTDGIDQKKLDDFLHWFQAGVSRELILAEHPNRAIMARVSLPPELNLLPFELDITIQISSNSYNTKTTLYKGDISLSLTMDEPHWYGIVNILGKALDSEGHKRYVDLWTDISTGEEVSIFASLDALKILYEDGIPLGSMIDTSMLLGNGAYANVDTNTESKIWSLSETVENYISEGSGARIFGTITGNETPASKYARGNYRGIIAGAIVDANDNGIRNLAAGQAGYFFYAGTAPAPVTISFTLTPQFSGDYISIPKNKYVDADIPYNTFTIESVTTQTLRFTTPNIFTSYNKVIELIESISSITYTWEDFRAKIRDTIKHKGVREWMINATSNMTGTTISSSQQTNLITLAKAMFGTIRPVTFTFNSKTGEAKAKIYYGKHEKVINENGTVTSSTTFDEHEEDVGDMLLSNYIIILDRNYPTSDGKILGWLDTNDTTKSYSHRIMHDVEGGLSNIQILYKNMYL